jgi:hypothetical protein
MKCGWFLSSAFSFLAIKCPFLSKCLLYPLSPSLLLHSLMTPLRAVFGGPYTPLDLMPLQREPRFGCLILDEIRNGIRATVPNERRCVTSRYLGTWALGAKFALRAAGIVHPPDTVQHAGLLAPLPVRPQSQHQAGRCEAGGCRRPSGKSVSP